MIFKRISLVTIAHIFLLHIAANAQSVTSSPKYLDKDMLSFFIGQWSGEGQFANGKKIAADVSFSLSLDSCWVVYTHTDKSPGMYKAMSMWGVDKATGKPVDYIFNNFQGNDKYTSDGWANNKIIWFKEQRISGGSFFTRFTYEKLDENRFKMTYEVSKDNSNWKMGDFLIFVRK